MPDQPGFEPVHLLGMSAQGFLLVEVVGAAEQAPELDVMAAEPDRQRPVAPVFGSHGVGQHDETLMRPPAGHITPV
ncbi:MAG: hypothetical protein ABSB76_11090, partial [Streptosporangiaceae bacterium]